MNLYDQLGVHASATKEQIKRAYRKKALKEHPDHGGSEVEFKKTAVAHRILSDDEKRARYDKGENPDSINCVQTDEQKAAELIISIFDKVVEHNGTDLIRHDLIDIIRCNLVAVKNKAASELAVIDGKIEKFKITIKKINHPGVNIISRYAASKCADLEKSKCKFQDQIKISDAGIKMLKDYSYNVEKPNGFNLGFMNYGA